jgi:hypothetical protein
MPNELPELPDMIILSGADYDSLVEIALSATQELPNRKDRIRNFSLIYRVCSAAQIVRLPS